MAGCNINKLVTCTTSNLKFLSWFSSNFSFNNIHIHIHIHILIIKLLS